MRSVPKNGGGAEAGIPKSQSITATAGQPKHTRGATVEGTISIKIGDSELLYGEHWLGDGAKWFERLKNEVPWSPEKLKMFNKLLELERQTCNYGDDYDYNPNAKPALPWAGPVAELKKMAEDFTGLVLTQGACNMYPDGETGIGLHHDKRHPLTVVAISFGAVRTIGFAPKGGKLDKSLPMIPLASGSLLLFTNAVNENFKHTIIEDKSVRGPRISVTFRQFAVDAKTAKQEASVALQQKSQTDGLNSAPAGVFPTVDYSKHTDDQLHEATVAALATYKQKCGEADDHAYDVLIPALNQVIKRYKQQGRAKPYRLNGCPSVEAYFESVGLNYSTVRSWKSRAQQRLLQAAADAGTKPKPKDPDPVPQWNKATRRALVDGCHKAVEMKKAVEAGRDAKKEIAEFDAVMNAKRLDDILYVDHKETEENRYNETLHRIKQNYQNDINAKANGLARMVIDKKSENDTVGLAKEIIELYQQSIRPEFFEAKAKREMVSTAPADVTKPKVKKNAGRRGKATNARPRKHFTYLKEQENVKKEDDAKQKVGDRPRSKQLS